MYRTSQINPKARHWIAAGILAAAVHAFALVSFYELPTDGAAAPGTSGIVVSISMAAAQAGDEAAPAAAVPVNVEEPMIEPGVSTTVEPAEQDADSPPDADAPDVPMEETVAVAEEAAVQQDTKPAEDVTLSPVSIDTAPVVASVLPETEITATPLAPRPASKAEALARMPVAEPRKSDTRDPASREQRFVRAVDTAQPDSEQASSEKNHGGEGQSRQKGDGGAAIEADGSDVEDAVGGGVAGMPSTDYMSRLRYWLDRHKTYPREARRKRMQGTVILHFRVTREGVVMSHEIRQRSGYLPLDIEAEAMLARAQPLPSFTEAMTGDYLDITVPVQFFLRGNR